MKVLITVPRLSLPGGVANYYRTLRSYLDADKVYLEIGRVPGECGRWRKLCRLLGDYWRFHRLLSVGSFDLVHVNPSMDRHAMLREALLILIAKAHQRRVLVYYRGWHPDALAAVHRRFPRLFRRIYGRVDASIVLAREFREVLHGLDVSEPIFLETTVVDDQVFATASDRAAARDSCNILFLSRLDTGKGVPEALAAFAELQLRRPDARLTIAGDGPERAAAEQEVARRRLANVRFLGHVSGPDKARVFREADIYLFTSLAEGMPNSVLEAMAFGLPVVTRPVGGIRDFFEDGRMGFAIDSLDARVFAERLQHLADDPQLRMRIGANNREFAASRFSASRVAARLLSIYEQVVAGPGRP
ncbi:MAG: glycosyltransferase family 4 protein [Gammaproteobacteria bacterium]|nr:glycosyltransferase family 4 protein [Gammaproteobacteria bacterium]